MAGAFLPLIVMIGCNHGGQEVDTTVSADESRRTALAASLEVTPRDTGARLVLHVTNAGEQPIELQFGTAQRYDFAVSTPAGEELWRWSNDQAFAQVVGTETLEAGATVRYSATWTASGRSGEFIASGMVTANNRRIQQRTRFTLPSE